MLNKVSLIGSLGRDPELKFMPDGTAVVNMSLATSLSYKKDGQKVTETEWHRITAYGKLAEIAGQYAKKGGSLYVEGRLKTRKWTDKDGVEKYTTEIIMSEMKLLGGKRSEESGDESQSGASQSDGGFQGGVSDMDDDIPF